MTSIDALQDNLFILFGAGIELNVYLTISGASVQLTSTDTVAGVSILCLF